MAAKVSVEYGTANQIPSGTTNGLCVAQAELTVSSSTATTTLALTVAHQVAGANIARIVSEDTACYVARGTSPDPTATVARDGTSARRMLPAGGVIELPIGLGDKIAVKAI